MTRLGRRIIRIAIAQRLTFLLSSLVLNRIEAGIINMTLLGATYRYHFLLYTASLLWESWLQRKLKAPRIQRP